MVTIEYTEQRHVLVQRMAKAVLQLEAALSTDETDGEKEAVAKAKLVAMAPEIRELGLDK